jgi:hypothetical protein
MEASVDAALDTSTDGGAPDAAADGAAVSPCSVSRDVFYVNQQGVGPRMYTNLGANFDVSEAPYLAVTAETGSGPAATLEVYTAVDAGLVPGVYPQGPSTTGPSLEIALDGEGCAIASGTLTVTELQTTPSDAAPASPTAHTSSGQKPWRIDARA